MFMLRGGRSKEKEEAEEKGNIAEAEAACSHHRDGR
jgi:hypothetical protein